MKMFDIAEIENALDVSRRVLLLEVERGNLNGTKIGRSWKFSFRDLEKYLGIEKTRELFGPRPGVAFDLSLPKSSELALFSD